MHPSVHSLQILTVVPIEVAAWVRDCSHDFLSSGLSEAIEFALNKPPPVFKPFLAAEPRTLEAVVRTTLLGTLLAILIVLNIRNGMALLNITGHVQTGVIGLLLIASVIAPRLLQGRGRAS